MELATFTAMIGLGLICLVGGIVLVVTGLAEWCETRVRTK